MPDQHILPRWRGFNLLDLYTVKHDGTFPEQDVRWIAEFGFDFVRLPMTYRLWTDPDDRFVFREDVLQKLDRGIDQAIDHGLHVCLNIHHAPGYCINKKADETTNLWKDPEPLEAFVHYWTHFARRYRGIA
ncbi:MAG: glycoside hydrolase family 5 protein, partial [Planctomycetota bacterium]